MMIGEPWPPKWRLGRPPYPRPAPKLAVAPATNQRCLRCRLRRTDTMGDRILCWGGGKHTWSDE